MPTRNPQQLLLIKQLYEDARLLAGREDDLSVMKATLSLDHSVEQMLNTIIMDMTTHNVPQRGTGRKDIGWGDIWKRAMEAIESAGHDLMNHAQLLSLHEVRNLAQHNGSIPTQAEVRRYIEPVEEMLAGAFRDVYGLDFQSFRLWDLVPNEDLRQLLRDSERALEMGRPGICVIGCSQAHSKIVKAIREHTKLRRLRFSQVFSQRGQTQISLPAGVPHELRAKGQQAAQQINSEIRRGVAQFRSEIMKEIEFLEDEVVTIGIGMPIMDTRRFLKIGDQGMKPTGYGGIVQYVQEELDSDTEESRDGARFMLSYLSRLVRLIHEAYPEVVKSIEVSIPLTSQSWWQGVENQSKVSGDA